MLEIPPNLADFADHNHVHIDISHPKNISNCVNVKLIRNITQFSDFNFPTFQKPKRDFRGVNIVNSHLQTYKNLKKLTTR